MPYSGDDDTSFWTHPLSTTAQAVASAAQTAGSLWYNVEGDAAPPPATGLPKVATYYQDGEYIYRYDPQGAIQIVRSPRSRTATQVTPKSAAYKAIYGKIRSGTLTVLTPEQVKAQRSTVPATPTPTPSGFQPSTPAPVFQLPPVATPKPVKLDMQYAKNKSFLDQPYAPWVAGGAVLLITVAAVLALSPRGKK
jgi:hypothetical protein